MICPVRDDLYRYPWPGMTEEERTSLRRHTSECDACRATVVRLGHATELLAGSGPELAPSRRVALWSAIEAETSAPRIAWIRPALGLALAVALVFVVALRLGPGRDRFNVTKGTITAASVDVKSAPPSRPLLAATDAELVRGSVHMDVVAGTAFEIPLRDFVRLEEGRLAVDVDGADPFTVDTAAARVEMIGDARVVVQVAAEPLNADTPPRARVEVARGRATIMPDGEPAIVIDAPGAWTNLPEAEIRARHRADLERARALVYDDAPAARRLAQGVLDKSADGAEAVDALAVIADAHRRRGEHRLAAEFYGRVAAHPSGRGYAEEALLRRAKMLRALGDVRGALAALEEAEERFARGPLAPERVALEARTLLELGRVDDAAKVLSDAEPSHALDAVRREVEREREMKRSKGSGYP